MENMENSRRKPRFKILSDGKHEHRLVDRRTEVSISDNLCNLIRSKWKLQKEEVNERELSQIKSKEEKYGRGKESIGYGRSGSVRLSRKTSLNTREVECYAIKEYRCTRRDTLRLYRNRSTSSFCISSCLQHHNIINALDLIQEPDGTYCEVMAFCDGGNLAISILRNEKLDAPEANCFLKQLARGLDYLHSVGVAHRDLKPENLLLTGKGALKIADFGEAECFRFPWEEKARMSTSRCGSITYISPEQFLDGDFDPRPADVWAMGMIYMAMRTGKLLWTVALKKDNNYRRYLEDRKGGFGPIEKLEIGCRAIMYKILDPLPSRRPTTSERPGSDLFGITGALGVNRDAMVEKPGAPTVQRPMFCKDASEEIKFLQRLHGE